MDVLLGRRHSGRKTNDFVFNRRPKSVQSFPETHESETHANVVVIPVAGTGAVAMLLSYLVRQSVKK